MDPDEHTIQETFVDVGDGHRLYVQEWGTKQAKTSVIFLHGGPGGSSKDKHKDLFDPERQRVVFFDQRGCGKSLPYGSLEHNTTPDLVDDIEKIAARLELDKVIITGGSWGSCLALAYALRYPARVEAMVLRGIFTGSQAELDYLDKGYWAGHFPDVWDAYLDRTPERYHADPSRYHFSRILGDDPVAAKESAYAYENVEGALLKLDDRHMPDGFEEYDPSGIIMETHYARHGCFLPDRYILENAPRLTMPVYLVQGRYDFVCPPVTAYELHHKLPQSELIWTVSGHKDERESWNVSRALLLQLAGK